MKKLHFISWLVLLIFISSCTNDEIQQDGRQSAENTNQPKLLTLAEVNNQITSILEETGSFNWSDASDLLLWSATVYGDHILSVGYGKKDESFRTEKSERLTSIKNNILESIKNSPLEKNNKKVLLYDDKTLNLIDVKVTDFSTVKMLRENDNIRYIEPEGFEYSGTFLAQEKSGVGCDKSSDYIHGEDFGHLGATKGHLSWNFYTHKINEAWWYSTGKGVGVGVIDTGISPYQPYLGYKFDDFYPNRYISKHGTYVDSWKPWATHTDGPNDKCGHGTCTAAAIGAPNNNSHQFVGVAYDCNLITYRASHDVLLNGYHERKGVARALIELGNRYDVKIISMSVGSVFDSGRIGDAVRYAYARGKMIFAAAGTSFNSILGNLVVIFPARMSETVCITGVRENTYYKRCKKCHFGRSVDFTFVMERDTNDHHQVLLGFYNKKSRYFAGSSVATASTAGIAALVWSKHPSWSRAQVLQRLKFASDTYPHKKFFYGYGNINAVKAVRGY